VITRPLDLASHLMPPPRSWDPLFYVNVGLLALFFSFFGSRFILSPAVTLMALPGAATEEVPTTHFITVQASGQIYADPGVLSLDQLSKWLKDESRKKDHPSLLVRANKDVTLTGLSDIIDRAREAGFSVVIAAEQPAPK